LEKPIAVVETFGTGGFDSLNLLLQVPKVGLAPCASFAKSVRAWGILSRHQAITAFGHEASDACATHDSVQPIEPLTALRTFRGSIVESDLPATTNGLLRLALSYRCC
jgi:hypothetical protein